MKRAFLALGGFLVIACASAPPPRVFAQMDGVRNAPAVAEARTLAPNVYARAEQLRRAAEAAHAEGRPSRAQVLAEHAVATYEHAVVLTRLAKAESRLASAEKLLEERQAALAEVDEAQSRTASEAEALELRVRVARDALPLVPNTPASPERERARLQAARALVSQARLLCGASQLLTKTDALEKQLRAVEQLEKALRGEPKNTPIDDAMKARSMCLSLLTQARRSSKADDGLQPDALLTELSRSGALFPFRDDRGVVVALRGLFTGKSELTEAGTERLELLGRVAKAHPTFPIQVVVHTARGNGDTSRGERVAATLRSAGATQVQVEVAGSQQPVVAPGQPDSGARNERVEVVFVAPVP